jgi:hypothetical protein
MDGRRRELNLVYVGRRPKVTLPPHLRLSINRQRVVVAAPNELPGCVTPGSTAVQFQD